MIEVRAPAKINLYLHITGRRPDGYHLLDSLVAFADIGDTLHLTASTGYKLTVDGPFHLELGHGNLEGNLVTRAARALALALDRPLNVGIRLTKNLPVASGIGGGSADAAATLRGLCRLWDVHASHELLLPIAQEIGQDVAVCVAGTPAHFVGIGDTTRPAPAMPPAWLVLVNPGFPLPTPSVFQAYRAQVDDFSQSAPLEQPLDFDTLVAALLERRNDLQPAAVSLRPEIDHVLQALSSCQGCRLSRMSGSGATCFGLFSSSTSAENARARLAHSHEQWWVAAATLAVATEPHLG